MSDTGNAIKTKYIGKKNPNTAGHRGVSDQTPQNTTLKMENKTKRNIEKRRLHIATLNTRSLKSKESLTELEQALSNINWDILGISDVRRSKENIEEHKEYIIYYKNEIPGIYGVGFLVKKYLKNNIIEFKGVSDRIAVLNILLPGHKHPTSIVQVYAPTEVAKKEIKNSFYENLNETMESLHNTTIVMGDFNSQIGQRGKNEEKILGPYTTGKRNDNGQRLINYALENNLYIMNTFYKRKHKRKWTWESPNGQIRNEIDFITTNKPKLFLNVEVLNKFDYFTDHRLLRGQLHLKEPKNSRKHIQNTKHPITLPLPSHVLESLKTKLIPISELRTVQEKYDTLEEEIKGTNKTLEKDKPFKDRIGMEARRLIKQRALLFKNRKNNRQNIVKISKEIYTEIRKYRNTQKNKLIQLHITRLGGIKSAWKELQDHTNWITNVTHHKTQKHKSKRNEILNTATDFYRDLYHDEPSTSIISNETVMNTEEEPVPNILKDEVIKAINSQKKGKAPGEDNISNELLKGISKTILDTLTDLFNEILRTEYIPLQWTTSTIILLHKKGRIDDISNYRPISLMSNVYKIFSKIIVDRISKTIDENQPKEQAGFRTGFSTIDHIHTIKQMVQKCNEYGINYYLAFIDYNKAFDSLKHEKIWEALTAQRIHSKYINIIKNIYINMEAKIRTEKVGECFPIRKGVRQGDPLSPKLFLATLEHIFRQLEWKEYGINVNGVLLNHLRFADDLILISGDPNTLQVMIEELINESEKVGLSINTSKTKLMTNYIETPIKPDNAAELEYVNEYTYLGQIISPTDTTTKEIQNRINLGWKRYWALKDVMKNSQIPIEGKKKIFNTCILPSMTYGCQTWSCTKKNIKALETCQHRMERSILNIKLKDKIRLKTIRKQTKIIDIKYQIKQLKWKWAGHQIRSKTEKWTNEVTEWCPRYKKRSKGRQFRRWEDDIKEVAGPCWMRTARDRSLWRTLGEAYAKEQDNHETGV